MLAQGGSHFWKFHKVELPSLLRNRSGMLAKGGSHFWKFHKVELPSLLRNRSGMLAKGGSHFWKFHRVELPSLLRNRSGMQVPAANEKRRYFCLNKPFTQSSMGVKLIQTSWLSFKSRFLIIGFSKQKHDFILNRQAALDN